MGKLMNLSATGFNQKELYDLIVMINASFAGLTAKLDADATVNDTDYEDNCSALVVAIMAAFKVSEKGLVDKFLIEWMYALTDGWETLCEQLDADTGVALTTYEANAYTAKYLHLVTNKAGSTLGNGTAYKFRAGGVLNNPEFIDWLYNALDSLETLTEQLDGDATVTDTNYEALWFTATILLSVKNSAGNSIGVLR